MEKSVASNDNHIPMDPSLDNDAAVENDDRRGIRRILGERRGNRRRRDELVRRCQRLTEVFPYGSGPGISYDNRLGISAGARNRAGEDQRRDARAKAHRASSRKFLSRPLPCSVMTDSG